MASHAEPINLRMAKLCLHALYDSVCEILKFLGIISNYPAFVKELAENSTSSPISNVQEAEKTKKKVVIKIKRTAYTYNILLRYLFWNRYVWPYFARISTDVRLDNHRSSSHLYGIRAHLRPRHTEEG